MKRPQITYFHQLAFSLTLFPLKTPSPSPSRGCGRSRPSGINPWYSKESRIIPRVYSNFFLGEEEKRGISGFSRDGYSLLFHNFHLPSELGCPSKRWLDSLQRISIPVGGLLSGTKEGSKSHILEGDPLLSLVNPAGIESLKGPFPEPLFAPPRNFAAVSVSVGWEGGSEGF